MALVLRRRVLRVKTENPRGTAAAATDAYILANDPVLTADDTIVRRPANTAYGGFSKATPGARLGTFRCTTDLLGNGSSGMNATLLAMFCACGWRLASTVLRPSIADSDQTTLTIDLFEDGVQKRLSGAHGTCRIVGEPGQPIRLEWNFRGVWNAPADAAVPTPAYAAQSPVRLASAAAFTLDAISPAVANLAVSLGNALAGHERATAAAGYDYWTSTDIDPQIELDPEAALVAAWDLHGKWLAGTTIDFQLVLSDGTTKFTIGAPAAQVLRIEHGERDGRLIWPIALQCLDSVGGDSLSITPAAA